MKVLLFCAFSFFLVVVSGFWDDATTTQYSLPGDQVERRSFFRWQEVQPRWRAWFFWFWDFVWLERNRRLNVVCGISHRFICIGTGTILNRRTIVTSCNLLEDYFNIQRELRIWALGARGEYYTPFRYRVWRITRAYPRTLNPEHMHGIRGSYTPRHDVCIIHTLDQMVTVRYVSSRGHYPHRSFVIHKEYKLTEDLWHTGSGYLNLDHMRTNYKIYIDSINRTDIVDCSKFLPKYWGKFICVKNVKNYVGIQNGAGFHMVAWNTDFLLGLGCFEIRYNEERILVFTDLRFYRSPIERFSYIYPGEYYEYAYPHWGMHFGTLWNSIYANSPRIPLWQIQEDFYPLG